MKQKTNKILITIASASMLFAGCSKSFLEKTPNDALTPQQALSNESGLQTAVNGIYSALRSVSIYGRDLPITGDLMADNTYLDKKNSGRYIPQYTYTVSPNDAVATELWQTSYTGIDRANQVIDANVTGAGVDQTKAEAYALRALLYFNLVNYYARPYTDNPDGLGVPLVVHYNTGLYPARNKVSEVYTQILSDLKTAFQNGPAYTSSARLSKYAIEGLLARVYLFMGDNTNAKAAAIDVINNSGFTLVPASSYDAYWANPAATSDQVETMFEVDADVINNNGFDDFAGMYENGYNDIYASQSLYDLYSATDVRKTVLIQGTTKTGAPAIIVDKFSHAASADRDNIKVLRLSEVYLIAAEASLPGDETSALMYLNDLMAQRDPSTTYSSTGAQLLTDIITERRKELAFEGNRFLDLNRLKMDVVRTANPGAIPSPTPAPLVIPYSDPRRIFPIPQTELQANKNIAGQQNPGY